jgi:hypothetical protein
MTVNCTFLKCVGTAQNQCLMEPTFKIVSELKIYSSTKEETENCPMLGWIVLVVVF